MSMKPFSVISTARDSEILIQTDVLAIRMLAAQLAANLISTCLTLPAAGVVSIDRASGVLACAMSWAPYGMVGALKSQADFLYAIGESLVSERSVSNYRSLVLSMDAQKFICLVAEGLQAFQNWKQKHCVHPVEVYGEDRVLAISLALRDWSDLNSRLLALIPQDEAETVE
jgi:hypothetical protein